MIWGAVIVAAGRGTRFGRPKQLVDLAGTPLVAWSVATFAAMPEIVELVVVTEADVLADMRAAIAPVEGGSGVRIVAGGATRQESVRLGMAAISDGCAGMFIHDGARPLVEAAHVRAGMRVVRPGRASVLAVPVIDTIKTVDAERRVTSTLARAHLWAAQTPQFAAARDLRRVHAEAWRKGWPAATDDAALLERGDVEVTVVEGSVDNFKVTVPGDLARAEAVLRERRVQPVDEERLLVVECFVPGAAVDAIIGELEARHARIDGIDRDLPAAVAVRAYVGSEELRGFGRRLHALAGEDALFTTHLSQVTAPA